MLSPPIRKDRGTSTKPLIHILDGRHEGERVNSENVLQTETLIELAEKNKVLLGLLTVLDIEGPLRDHEERARRRTVHTVEELSRVLSDFDCAFFKLVKPISYVPADIDILVRLGEASEVAKEVQKLGYTIAVKEPYCTTLVKSSSIVDLYAHPTIGGVAYMDGQAILDHVRLAKFDGVEIRTLECYAEALVIAAHAVYKEGIYTLNDFFTVKKWASKRSFELAGEIECEDSLKFAIGLNALIGEGLIEAPHKVSFPTWLRLMSRKFCDDRLTRVTFPNILTALRSKRLGPMALSRITRQTY